MLIQQFVCQKKSSIKISKLRHDAGKLISHNLMKFIQRDEVLTKNKFLEEEARRNALQNDDDRMLHVPKNSDDSDDIFYDSTAEAKEE